MEKIVHLLLLFCCGTINAQQITGYWHGNMGKLFGTKHELKIVLKGDSLVGTSYYYSSKSKYTKFSIKGYFDNKTNAVIWWDDKLLESKNFKIGILPQGDKPGFIAEADFNCPGSGIMKLEGKAKENGSTKNTIDIDLKKVAKAVFEDGFNDVIDNWTVGGNQPNFIQEVLDYELAKNEPKLTIATNEATEIVYTTSKTPDATITELELPVKNKPVENNTTEEKKPIEFLDLSKPRNVPKAIVVTTDTVAKQQAKPLEMLDKKEVLPERKIEKIKEESKIEVAKPMPVQTIPLTKEEQILEKKLQERKKTVLAELPLADSIQFYLYDNAEVDGDSVSLFLNDSLLYKHVLLSDKAFSFTLYKNQLTDGNVTLTMLAENLGSIPPNTSYMKAVINGKKYEATLSSTEQTSAVIRFRKE